MGLQFLISIAEDWLAYKAAPQKRDDRGFSRRETLGVVGMQNPN